MWTPQRRPGGENLALSLNPPLDCYAPGNIANGVARPTEGPNAWSPDWDDPRPRLTLAWNRPQTIRTIMLGFDTDFDHPMESVLLGHAESEMPCCVKRYRITDAEGRTLHEAESNHQTRNTMRLPEAVTTRALNVEVLEAWSGLPAVFEVRCYKGEQA
jgi:hypothetical protein